MSKASKNLVPVRVSREILAQLRELFPELKDESDSTIVRTALNKYIMIEKKR